MDKAKAPSIDLLTLIGIAAFAYVATAFFHEGVGHGAACVAVGGRPTAWGAYYFDCDTHALPAWTFRLVAAAGSTVNLILFGLFAFLSNRQAPASGSRGGVSLFFWIMSTINGLSWAGYFAFSGIANIGDWSTAPDGFLANLKAGLTVPVRIGMVIGGVSFYILIARMSAGALAHLIGGENLRCARRISFTTYLTGGATAVLISLANPVGLFITVASAAASSFGGTAGLIWTVRMMPRSATAAADWNLKRSWPAIALGAATVAIYAVVWGPSLTFGHPH